MCEAHFFIYTGTRNLRFHEYIKKGCVTGLSDGILSEGNKKTGDTCEKTNRTIIKWNI